MGKEYAVEHHIGSISQLLSYIFEITVENFSTVFFPHHHLILLDNNTGAEVEQIGSEFCHARTAPTGMKILESLNYEGNIKTVNRLLADCHCFLGRETLVSKLTGHQGDLPRARRKVLGIYNMDPFKLLSRKLGVLMGA